MRRPFLFICGVIKANVLNVIKVFMPMLVNG
jgi:hypothetical protein